VANGWVVESVETVPAGALGEWFIDRRAGRQRIEIQLSRPIDPQSEVSVVIAGRFRGIGVGELITADTMRMVRWLSASVARNLVTFQTREPYSVEPIGALELLAGDTISGADLALLDSDAGAEAIFDMARADETAGLKLTPKQTQYDANIWLDAACVGRQILQTHHLLIRPVASHVDRWICRCRRKD
jgi:hypothetical protein